MQVLKFGGTSVASAENITKVIAIVTHALTAGPAIVVVSALSGTTDALISVGRDAAAGQERFRATLRHLEERHLTVAEQLLPTAEDQAAIQPWLTAQFAELATLADGIFALGELSARTLDRLMSYGEILSSQLIAKAFQVKGLPAFWGDSRHWLRTDSTFGAARVDEVTSQRLSHELAAKVVDSLCIMPGFIGADAAGNTTTLGRGGSDYTAALAAAMVEADKLEIWTDVSGMLTADPRLVRSAQPISRLSYEEAMELPHRLHRGRVQHLGPEVRQLHGLLVAEAADGLRRAHQAR
ncbi:MAG: aspartate kinase, partial [Hymenobacter sp.]